MNTATRLRKPIRKRMWMKIHASQATKPVSRSGPIAAIAFARPMVAMLPLSR